jgi:hypothetical protein
MRRAGLGNSLRRGFGWGIRGLLVQAPVALFFLLLLLRFLYALFVALKVLPQAAPPFLASAVFAFRETVLAIDRTVFAGLERNLALFVTLGARRFEHFPRTPAAESTATLIGHFVSFLG